ncbi:MAG: DUF5010 domain-containing protein [Planctomycetota bacterium]
MARVAAWSATLWIGATLLPAQSERTPTVAAHYFYWYRAPDQHMGGEGREGQLHHFVDPAAVSYESASWHRAQFADMATAGIDVALPVYWGFPGCETHADLRFSVAGLPPMVDALVAMDQAGEAHPRLGLFYDTSTLRNAVRGAEPRDGRTDLTTAAGRALFCDTIESFFAAIPRRLWARHHGRPLVVLYVSGFAARWDRELGTRMRDRFASRFDGERPFLVADASWGDIGQDATTTWGAALSGPFVHGSVVQIGPGYDDSPVPGRHTPYRPREDGAFYRASWRTAVQAKPDLVLIETWDEMHEGTEVCRTQETGDLYLRLTRDGVDRLRRGDAGPAIELAFDAPRPRPDPSFGADAKGLAATSWSQGEVHGLRPIPWEDGPFTHSEHGIVAACPQGRPVTYVYFQVADAWRFDDDVDLEFSVIGDGDLGTTTLEYDSRDRDATLDGAYTPCALEGETTVFRLRRARLADRQNGGADLRLLVRGKVEIRSAELRATSRRLPR